MSIQSKIKNLQYNKAISLHVPGHHNNTIGHLQELDFGMDMTEITGLDDLHQPEGVIKKSMSFLNRYCQHEGHYLVNGTTVGILASIYALKDIEGDILIPRNAHKSIYNALKLTNQKATWMHMEVSNKTQFYKGVNDIEKLDLNKVKLVILTYPNYYGETFDIQGLIRKLKEYNVVILVDEAHGAHFGISNFFPASSLEFGADIVIQSYHKTLPALTMASVLYIRKNLKYKEVVKEYLSILQTSSPSYLLMASLEQAENFYKTYSDKKFIRNRKILISVLREKGLQVECPQDPLKLIVSSFNLSGFNLLKKFEEVYIFPELCNENFVLLILPLWHRGDTFLFEEMLERIHRMSIEQNENKLVVEPFSLPTKIATYNPQKAMRLKSVALKDAIGKISANNIVPYPPGVPVILEGEKISKSIVISLQNWINSGGRVEGIKNKQIKIKDEKNESIYNI